ncbi:hypothetical protein [uncultured Bradyrhizobium sp.]|uniref:hypothetical protein n=1 Tax=uncultured Bradyrhizobium sp. TaxID=199684 RepID=UPI0035CACE01
MTRTVKQEINFDEKLKAAQVDVRGPTPERLEMAAGAFYVGGDHQGVRTYIFADSPLGRMFKGRRIDPIEFTALQRYKHHWYHGGLELSVGTVDLNRIFASDPSNMSGMAKSERQAHHRQQYREARELIGHRPGIVVDNVVCAEWPLHIAGHSIGFGSPYRARLAATEILRDAGYRLAKLWGIG